MQEEPEERQGQEEQEGQEEQKQQQQQQQQQGGLEHYRLKSRMNNRPAQVPQQCVFYDLQRLSHHTHRRHRGRYPSRCITRSQCTTLSSVSPALLKPFCCSCKAHTREQHDQVDPACCQGAGCSCKHHRRRTRWPPRRLGGWRRGFALLALPNNAQRRAASCAAVRTPWPCSSAGRRRWSGRTGSRCCTARNGVSLGQCDSGNTREGTSRWQSDKRKCTHLWQNGYRSVRERPYLSHPVAATVRLAVADSRPAALMSPSRPCMFTLQTGVV